MLAGSEDSVGGFGSDGVVEEVSELSVASGFVPEDELESPPDGFADEFCSLLVGGVTCDVEESGEEPVCG